jgi:hypothetical protein
MSLWLLPVCLSFLIAMIYLGGWPRDVRGGNGLTQVLGLVISIVLFVAVWKVLNVVLGNLGGAIGWLVLPTVGATLLYPVIAKVSFLVCGIKVVSVQSGH